jgi:hypothetical protein
VDEATPICALVDDTQVLGQVPMEAKDIAVDFIITPTTVITVERVLMRPANISWDELNEKHIKSMRPLKELRRNNERQT